MINAKVAPHAGYVEVSKLTLTSYSTLESVDISGNFIKITIEENVRNPYLEGYIDIVDSYGMIYPTVKQNSDGNLIHVRGEEYLHIEYYDYDTFGDATQLKKETYFVYAIEEAEMLDTDKETGLQYRLYFTSPQKVFTDNRLVDKAYRNMTYSDMVRAIFQEYYSDYVQSVSYNSDENVMYGRKGSRFNYNKSIEIEETQGRYTIVFPGVTPEQAIQMIGRRAYSEENTSSFFMFFETREKYYFCTTEYLVNKNRFNLIDEAYRFEYSHGAEDNSPDGQDRAQQMISNGTLPNHNSLQAGKEQAYGKRVSEIDLNNRDIEHYYFSYDSMFNNYTNIDEYSQLPNSKSFIRSVTKESDEHTPETYVFKDYKNVGEQYSRPANYDRASPYYKETVSTKPVFDFHFFNSMMSGTIPGRGSLYPGDSIDVFIPQYTVLAMKEQAQSDTYFGGPQMIAGMTHVIEDNTWLTSISYTKQLRGDGDKIHTPGAAGVGVVQDFTTDTLDLSKPRSFEERRLAAGRIKDSGDNIKVIDSFGNSTE